MALEQKIIDDVAQLIRSGLQDFTGPGLDNMDVPYDKNDPPSPQAFQAEIKKQVAGSIALAIVAYIDQHLSEWVSPIFKDSFNDLFAEAIKNCTVEVKDSAGADLGTGTITYTPYKEDDSKE